MNVVHARELDLNLLPVLLAVAETGSVTGAAARLYLTQSAVSAALGRLRSAVGAPILTKHGRGVVLTERGAQLVAEASPHLDAIVNAVRQPAGFDPRTDDRSIRIGFCSGADRCLLPPLLRELATEAPRMRLLCTPVNFRTVGEELARRRIDIAVSVADDLPTAIARQPLLRSRFLCLFDPRHVRLGARPTERAYLAQDHVVVSYNRDARGLIEDFHGRERKVRCSVADFSSLAEIVDGSSLVATVPSIFVPGILELRSHLRATALPFPHDPGSIDLLWPKALEADPACRFVREAMIRLGAAAEKKAERYFRLE